MSREKTYDAIVVGSGFGGSMVARQLVEAGWAVLMLERGSWVQRGPANWSMRGSIDLTPHYDKSSPIRVEKGGNKKTMGFYSAVGGPSVFYGGVSFRFREADFHPPKEIVEDSGAEWPFGYETLEPFYSEAEAILGVSGEAGTDPTEPFRSRPFPQNPAPLAGISQKVRAAAESLGLHPFSLPLAINYEDRRRKTCVHCTTCDTFACAIGAKNDLATVLLPELQRKGLTVIPDTVVTRLVKEGKRVTGVECVSKTSGEKQTYRAGVVVLSAGSMGSPHLLLASGLAECNPAGRFIGRHLMRHVNAIVFGIFPGKADPEERFHKQLAILDYYFGHPDIHAPKEKLGSLQQMPTPPKGLVQNEVPGPLGRLLSKGVELLSGLLAIAEDQPRPENHLRIDPNRRDAFGLPQPVVHHTYTPRDKAASRALIRGAKRILRKAGALGFYVHPIRTFSHAVGTVRMGKDPQTAPLDPSCRFRGLDNLFVVDGSFMPTSAALNPSLTIAANALRVGKELVEQGR